jgi:hypothetical protein
MSILPKLIENKGTVSSALGKELARQALSGKQEILVEAIELLQHKTKNVFPVLEEAIQTVPKRIPRILESFSFMVLKMDEETLKKLIEYLGAFQHHEKPVIKSWAKKLLKQIKYKK